MTRHDEVRMNRAARCDRTNLEEVRDAVAGLQSTDDPSLVPLHDELMEVYERLRNEAACKDQTDTNHVNLQDTH